MRAVCNPREHRGVLFSARRAAAMLLLGICNPAVEGTTQFSVHSEQPFKPQLVRETVNLNQLKNLNKKIK